MLAVACEKRSPSQRALWSARSVRAVDRDGAARLPGCLAALLRRSLQREDVSRRLRALPFWRLVQRPPRVQASADGPAYPRRRRAASAAARC